MPRDEGDVWSRKNVTECDTFYYGGFKSMWRNGKINHTNHSGTALFAETFRVPSSFYTNSISQQIIPQMLYTNPEFYLSFQVTISQEKLRCFTTTAATTATSTDHTGRQQMRYNFNGICVSVLTTQKSKKSEFLIFVNKIHFRVHNKDFSLNFWSNFC